VGEGIKFVLTEDPFQINNPYVDAESDAESNELTWLVEQSDFIGRGSGFPELSCRPGCLSCRYLRVPGPSCCSAAQDNSNQPSLRSGTFF
jgi:hypothetical protein